MPARGLTDGAFIDAARLDEIARGSATVVDMPIAKVAVFNVDGKLFALDDSCLRCGGSLGHGTLRGHVAACPACGWRYDVRTGNVKGVPALHTDRFEVRVQGTRVMVAAVCM